MLSPSPSSLALGGSITLPQLVALSGLSAGAARLLAEKCAGQGRSQRLCGRLVLCWPLPAIADILAARGTQGVRPGGWVTLAFADAQLADIPAASRRKLLGSHLLRKRRGRSAQGTLCQLYALSDLLALLRNRHLDFSS